MALTALYDAAQALLSASESALATEGRPLPGRRYVALGNPAWDCCDQLVSRVVRVYQSDVSGGPTPHHRLGVGVSLILVDFEVSVVRCVPTIGSDGNPPPAAMLDASASAAYADAWALTNGLRERVREGTLLPAPPCREVEVLPAQPYDNQGGCGGWTFTVTAQLDGYHP